MPDSPVSLPVWGTFDVLVLGSTLAAVTAALRARDRGLSVAVLSESTSFGQDVAGTFALWAADGPAPVRDLAAGDGLPSVCPSAIRRHLEHSLLRAEVRFLFGTRPVALLRDAAGRVAGVVAATRTALCAMRAGTVIDTTAFGLACRLVPLRRQIRSDDREIRWRILAAARPKSWPGTVRDLPAFVQRVDGEPREFPAFELAMPRSALGADARSLAHRLRAELVDDAVFSAAAEPVDAGDEFWSGPATVTAPEDLAAADLQVADGLWLANRLAPVRDAAALTDPDRLSTLAGRVVDAAVSRHRAPEPPVATSTVHLAGWRFEQAFLRNGSDAVALPEIPLPDWGEVDVLVAGGGTGGAPAAIAAAREGARTLCVEAAPALGGVGTVGLISSYWFGNKTGFTTELDAAISSCDPLTRAKNGKIWNPELKSGTYHRFLDAAGGTAWMGGLVCGVRREGDRPVAVLVATPFGTGVVRTRFVVDATGNADLAAAAGAPVRIIASDHVAVQGTGLSPRLHPGVRHQNSDHTFIEENDPEGLTAAHVQAREKYTTYFETAPFINSRERRQILGEYEVSPLDILAERTFPDTIFTARSNFDTHGFIIHPVFMVVPPDHHALLAHVPLRCLIPRGLEGLLVTGLGLSAHRDALPVIRMQADVQNQGYAAGMLAADLARSGQSVRACDVKAFQRRLVAQGILTPETAAHTDSFPIAQEQILAAARGPLDNAREVAMVFAHAESAREALLARLRENADSPARHTAALILGLLGDPAAAPTLIAVVAGASWDEGWNYRGMGQFGPSMSRLDTTIIALGRTHEPSAVPALIRLAEMAGPDIAFSHVRALSLACACLRDPNLEAALERLLDLPGFCGHTFATLTDLLGDADGDPTATRSRNLALRELSAARGLYESGDHHRRGRTILESYTHDLRGHFARHARAVLARTAAPDPLTLA